MMIKSFTIEERLTRRSKVKRKNTIFIDDKTSKIIEKYKGSGRYIFNVLDDNVDELESIKEGKTLLEK